MSKTPIDNFGDSRTVCDNQQTARIARIFEIEKEKDFADSILSGDLTFDVLANNKGYQKGDYIRCKVVNRVGYALTKIYEHPLNNKLYEITYVLSEHGIEKGYVALCVREVILE